MIKINDTVLIGSFNMKHDIENLKKTINIIQEFLVVCDFTKELPYKFDNRDGSLYLENATVVCELDHNVYRMIVENGNYTIIDNDIIILEFKNNNENYMIDSFKLFNFLDDLENINCDIQLSRI